MFETKPGYNILQYFTIFIQNDFFSLVLENVKVLHVFKLASKEFQIRGF